MASQSYTDAEINAIAIQQAEIAAHSSLERFEHAVTELNMKLKESNDRLNRMMDYARLPKEKTLELVASVKREPESYLMVGFFVLTTLVLVRRVLFARD